MGLSYHFTLSAPASVGAKELVAFLKTVQADAQKLGFQPTLVLDVVFDTPERREFTRRVLRSVHIEDERLQGVVLPAPDQVWNFSGNLDHCRLAPERAVILVVTDERGSETVFGFARYPATLLAVNGRALLKTPVGDRWFFRDFVDSPDARLRAIVKRFAEARYVEAEKDEFAASR